MSFEFAPAFFLLSIFPVVFWILKQGEERTRKVANIFKSNAPKKSYYVFRTVSLFMFLSSLVAVGARPFIEYKESADYIFLIDVSRSMQARYSCGELTYLDRSKNVMRKILREIPEARFSIIAFDRFAFPITQMTYDHAYLNEVIEKGIYAGLYYQATATELENALSVIAQKKARVPEIYGNVKQVILLSDGFVSGDYRRRMTASLAELRDAGIKVITVGIGNPGQTPLMQTEQGHCIDEQLEIDGEIIMVSRRDDILKFIVGETQSQYFSETETDKIIELLRNNMYVTGSNGDGIAANGHGRDISWIFLVIATLSLLGVFLSSVNVHLFGSIRHPGN